MTFLKYVNSILVIALLLTGLFAGLAGTAYAQCPGSSIYVDTQTGNDNTNNGSAASPFQTVERAMGAAASCTTAVNIYLDGRLWRQIPAPIPEGTGLPVAQTVLIGGLVLLAALLLGGAALLRRRFEA